MDIENIEHIAVEDVVATKSLNNSPVKMKKQVPATAKPCVYFKDVECRAPMCDMEVCQKCPEGHGFCDRTLLIKRMIQRVMLFFIGFILFCDF